MKEFDDFDPPCPDSTVAVYCMVLGVGDSAINNDTSREALGNLADKAHNVVMKLLRRHASDSPGPEDQRRFVIDLLTKALAIAKGEEKL